MNRYNLTPAILLVLGSILAILLGNAVNRSQMNALSLEAQITAEQVKLRLEACTNSRVAVVNQLAVPQWTSMAELRRNWIDEADSLVNLFPGIQGLNYIGVNGIIELVYPVDSNNAALGADLFNHPNPVVVSALNDASQSSQLTRTNTIELIQSGSGFAMYQKILSTDGETLGFANGVFRTSDLVEACLSEQELRNRFEFRLTETDGSLVYKNSETFNSSEQGAIAVAAVSVAGRAWQLELAPTTNYFITTQRGVADVWVFVGLLMVIFIAASARSLLLKQESLRDSQEKYRLLIENQTDMVVKVTPEHDLLYVSPSYCRNFDKSEEELLGSPFLPLIHEEDRAATLASLAGITAENPNCYHEQRALTKQGWRWMAWSNTGIFDENNKLQAITAVGRDITDMRKLKEDIAHNQKMQAIGEMASGITHDFNNLLQVMMANIEFLIRGNKENPKARGQLEKIFKALERARALIDKLSTLSKQELLIKNVVELNRYSVDVIEMFKQSLPENINITLHQAPQKLHVDIDAGQFERVLLNLFINAKEAMKERGNIEVSISTKTLDKAYCSTQTPPIQPGVYACLKVADTGHGIPAKSLSRIFDPFYSTKNKNKSSGLGLANSYSIVKQLDGVIEVASTEGAGTTFSIFLPLVSDNSAASPAVTTDVSESNSVDKKLILVADDETELLDVTCQMLEENGYETLAADNGKKALDLYKQHRDSIALVVLDLVMPVMSGQQAAFEIRKVTSSAKILFISGYIPETDGRTIRLDGPLLRKPFRTASLMDKVNGILHPDSNQ